MRLSVIFDDALVMKDGVGYRVTLPDEPDVHAIQWTGEAGEIEYRDQHTPNEVIGDESVLSPYVALWQAAHDAASAPSAEPPRRLVKKSTVMSRLLAMGKATTVRAAFDANPEADFRWHTPDWPSVYADDDGLLVFLRGIGLTEAQIEAVTAP